MTQHVKITVACCTGLLLCIAASFAVEQQPESSGPFGLEKRVPWTTSKIQGTPDPPAPYRTVVAFPHLKFNEPLAMTSVPGSDRLFVVERFGKIYSFPNDPNVKQADLFLDLGKVIYGLALHPKFTENGYFYITYVTDPAAELPTGTHVARFQATGDDPPVADVASEQLLLQWPSGGHNGGCLKFGPDGYLYIVTGDASGIADQLQTGQDISDLPGSLLRIDVDHATSEKPYSIPRDNPFVNVEGAQPEVWAYGLRQLWKMSFDRKSGQLWGGNVGQDLWEMVLLLESGGNYGWSVTEGSYPFRPERSRGPSPIIKPIFEYNHTEGRSITGGYVYHGSQLPDLQDSYVYGDYDSGRIWALRYDGKSVTENRELVDSSLRLVGFAEDNQGELFLVDHMGGAIHRLQPSEKQEAGPPFPRKLSETGLFADVASQKPAAGVIPYSINAPMWSDGAVKEFFLAVPGDSQIDFEAITYPQPAPGAPAGWKFPDGTVLAETISIELEPGNSESLRRLETRILHHERLAGGENVGDQYWQGYTYIWNEAGDDAVLLEDPQGRDETLLIHDPQAPGGKRRQTWHFPSRAECTVCHNMAAKYALGATTLQMNKSHDYGAVTDNQLRTLEHIGLFSQPLPKRPADLPHLADYRDESLDLSERARSYLHTNCSHCHRKWGGGNAEFQLLATLPLEELGISGVRPGQGTFQIPQARVLTPGDPHRSVLFYRMAKAGSGRMPRLGSTVHDKQGLQLVHEWIDSLTDNGKTESGRLQILAKANIAADEKEKLIDEMLASTEAASQLAWTINQPSFPQTLRDDIVAHGVAHAQPEVRDLFERFLPEEKRPQRLGSVIQFEKILALPGDAARGEEIFLNTAGVQCKNCHRIKGQGTELGPDLTQIGKKYTRAQILESIVEPSKTIDPKFTGYLVETKKGKVHTGLLVKRDEREIVLKDTQNKEIHINADEVELVVPQQKSFMPELLLREMTARDVADLTAYLSRLK